MKRLLLSACLLLAPTVAQAGDSAWVQATASGFEARLATTAATCPALQTDGGEVPMTVRVAASADFPLTCAARLAPGTAAAAIAGIALPLPHAKPQRILVLGDTGCRIQGAALQACNDPHAWPFPALAQAAAALKPDLVIHVGDYHYRETPCPPGNAGCAGSPWGDNWATWQADFFVPAAPLLAAAPVVLARGNHEDCTRAGIGWTRLLASQAHDAPCIPHEPLYVVDIGDVRLAVMDDATAPETRIIRDDAPVYAAELAQMAAMTPPVWFVHHRPVWAAVSGPLGIPIGGNLTLIEATRQALAKAGHRIPRSVELMLSGHIHSFQAINYAATGQPVPPPQIVAGNGGDNLHDTPRNLRGTQFLGHSGVTVADGLSAEGFGFLLMTRSPEGWTVDLHDSAGVLKGQCRFVSPARRRPGRVDCPTLK